mmetsp:Transcript_16618/g.22916  ORF Transcript_16618/g.22916 Transcript_16618/m.22916 type:complete len:221 (+) Transcript_16618:152-814(+)|eukprot:CAMPEP_0196578898 /NCGR_PEP_ID=MMETSP1081-20130531/11888_1 /TAXON_ID=36882 /ORGANISM="Pyramimonas amylifera, Strain CCMP720" /LENGTH=220 /DNA_ID=CAMNT_0041898285 /DNA_START=93 /DNA_END=755 /DNA_ORIENTATION=+
MHKIFPAISFLLLTAWTSATELSSLHKGIHVWVEGANTCSSDLSGDDKPDPTRLGCELGLTNYPALSNITFMWNITDVDMLREEISADALLINTIELKRCFSPDSTDKRPWRKTKSALDKDKQCKKQFAKVPWTPGTIGSFTYNFPDPTPGAVYFVRAFALQDDTYLAYGDSSDNQGYFKYTSFDGLTDAIKVSVAIMSVLSWVLLFGYFAYDLRPKSEA